MQAQSLVPVPQDSEFPLQNIPFGIFSPTSQPDSRRPATRIGNHVVDLKQLEKDSQFTGELFTQLKQQVFQGDTLNKFMELDRRYWKQARTTIQQILSKPVQTLKKYLYPIEEVSMHLPARIGDYTDFYSSRSHAFNVGSIIRGKDNAMNENWFHIPIGYHGRSSSIVATGTPLRRPRGQTKAKDAKQPSFTECKRLDYEMEMGAFVGGRPNQLGEPIKVNEAWNYIFGFVLLNDWSFRDFQTWEYVPLGPFTAKNGISTISPWIITLEALQGTQVPLSKQQQPSPLKYLQQTNHISYDINLTVNIKTPTMSKPQKLITTNYKYLYWSCAQQLAHHSVTGCNMRAGDLLGSGTISGDAKQEFGSLLELTWGGRDDIELSNGEKRKFVQDGDSIVMTGQARRNGKIIGFGEAEGTVLPVLGEERYY